VKALLATEQRYALGFGAGMLVVLALLSGLIADRVVGRPLEGLALAMKDVEAGNLRRRVTVHTEDEVGRVGQGFNRMLERLEEADAEIRAFNQRLAEEIRAATHDLSEKNAALGQLNRLLNDMRRENASKVRLATLGQLAAQLAHEIGTPLSSVSGHLQLALLQRDLPAPLRERLEVGSREIERISRIVRDYLDSTRPLEPERTPTDLPRLLEEAVELTRGADPSGPPAIAVAAAPDLHTVVTDPGLLRQVLVNLLANARDAIGGAPDRAVRADGAAPVNLTARAEGDDMVITVSDTGPGIAPDDLRRIFEPFYTTKGRGKGTGLGLAICRQLTAALGGSIAVESEPGVGSTFTLRLPRAGAPRGDGAVPSPMEAAGSSGRVQTAAGGRS
jgi:two-component system, NtrC family, sensor kinase